MTDLVEIGPWQLAMATTLILLNGGLSLWLRVGLTRQLLVASARTVVQLLLLGWILVPIFAFEQPWMVVGIGIVMIALATREAVRRSARSYKGIYGAAFLALFLGCGASALLGSAIIVGVEPWWDPRYLIPLLGMVLGNALTGLSLGIDRCLSVLDEQRARVEAMLSMGATWWEAARPVAGESIRVAMIPILNAMSAVGLVTIPGMMTGQLLGGTPPDQAARYQIVIMFMIAAAVALGSVIAVLVSLRALFDSDHRLRHERIHRRPR